MWFQFSEQWPTKIKLLLSGSPLKTGAARSLKA